MTHNTTGLDVHFINTLPVLMALRHARLRGHDVLLAPDLQNRHLARIGAWTQQALRIGEKVLDGLLTS